VTTAVSETLRPADAGATAAALAEASRERRRVRIRGADTKAYLGEQRPADLVLETRAMSGIVDHVPADLTVTVRAGTPFAELRDILGASGQMLPLDPPHASSATIGGVVAANSNGFWRLRYGGVRDLLIGIVVALADGSVARAGGRVVKNVAGYDLDKLFIGSFGTLGVLAEATFKVLPLPSATALALAPCSSAAAAFKIADALLHTALRPAALVVEGSPGGWRTLVAAAGERAQVDRTIADAVRAAAAVGSSAERLEDDALLSPLRELPARAVDGALVRVALPLGAQRSFVETVAGLDAFASCVVDAGSGLARVHLRGDDDAVVSAADTSLAAGTAVGGSGRIERREAKLARRLAIWGGTKPGGDFLMRRLKDAFDPAGILEPGRSIVG
jgi:glycolate dehydrogenase FAD-binding subunit